MKTTQTRTNRGYLHRACHSKGGSILITRIWQKVNVKQRGKHLWWEIEASGMLLLEVVGMGKLKLG